MQAGTVYTGKLIGSPTSCREGEVCLYFFSFTNKTNCQDFGAWESILAVNKHQNCFGGEAISDDQSPHKRKRWFPLRHSDTLDYLKNSWSTNNKDKQSQQPWSHGVFVFSGFQCLWDVATVNHVLAMFLIRNSHPLFWCHDRSRNQEKYKKRFWFWFSQSFLWGFLKKKNQIIKIE